jgi:GntR family transcriptional regulator/GntR family frlABCD operon transcriptional regulator
MAKQAKTQTNQSIFLYEQVKIHIRQMIESGELKVGERIPSENELCDCFETSRITIRRALKDLENDGVLEIRHGKGTFVSKVKQPLHILNLKGFAEGRRTQDVRETIVSKTVVVANDKERTLFERSEPFELLKLERVIWYQDHIFSIDFTYLPLDVYPGIQDSIQDNVSVFRLIRQKYGLQFKKAIKEIEVIYPSAEISKLLGISKLDPVIQVKKLILDADGVPVHYSKYYLLADRVKFYIDVDMHEDSTEMIELPDL